MARLEWTSGSGSPLPVKVLCGPAAPAGAAVAVFQTRTRFFESFVDMADAPFRLLIEFVSDLRGFPAGGSKMQLGPWPGPSCNALVAFCAGYGAWSGLLKVLLCAHRS